MVVELVPTELAETVLLVLVSMVEEFAEELVAAYIVTVETGIVIAKSNAVEDAAVEETCEGDELIVAVAAVALADAA